MFFVIDLRIVRFPILQFNAVKIFFKVGIFLTEDIIKKYYDLLD